MHDTRHNWHQLIKSGNPSDEISIKNGRGDSKPTVLLHETRQGMNQQSYRSLTSDTS